MRLSDLRPCDGCAGPIFLPPGRTFWVVRSSCATVTDSAVELIEAADRNPGLSLDRLEAAHGGVARGLVAVLGDERPELLDELLLCSACYQGRSIADLARLRRLRAAGGSAAAGAGRPS